MAGSFGFERGDKYDVSVRAGERSLLPRVREADEDVLIVADGFSCREQIMQGTGRKAMHLAEVIQIGLRQPARFPNLPRFIPAARTAAFILAAGTLGALALMPIWGIWGRNSGDAPPNS